MALGLVSGGSEVKLADGRRELARATTRADWPVQWDTDRLVHQRTVDGEGKSLTTTTTTLCTARDLDASRRGREERKSRKSRRSMLSTADRKAALGLGTARLPARLHHFALRRLRPPASACVVGREGCCEAADAARRHPHDHLPGRRQPLRASDGLALPSLPPSPPVVPVPSGATPVDSRSAIPRRPGAAFAPAGAAGEDEPILAPHGRAGTLLQPVQGGRHRVVSGIAFPSTARVGLSSVAGRLGSTRSWSPQSSCQSVVRCHALHVEVGER